MSYVDKAKAYAEAVIRGDTIANRYVIKACQRYIDDLAKEDWRWEFSDKHANHICSFLEHGIKHVKGPLQGDFIKLEDWQCFVICNLYGWRDGKIRRFQTAMLEIARKNGKTLFASGLAIYEMLFGEEGGEIYSLATKMDQAKLAWEGAEQMILRSHPDVKASFKIVTNQITNTSRFCYYKPLGRDSKSLDGLNPSLCIYDEAAAYSDRNLVEVMTSATGARDNFLHLFITTAQFSKTTIYYENRQYMIDILEGRVDNDRWFGVIYTLDDGDDWQDPNVWEKANPNIGVSIKREYLAEQVEEAKTMTSKRNGVLVKHFNIYTSAEHNWISLDEWQKNVGSMDRSGDLYIGMDLSSTRDITALAYLWPSGDKFSLDFQCFIPRTTLENLPVHMKPKYLAAIESGMLHVTSGDVVDYRAVKEHIKDMARKYKLKVVGYDKWNANILVNELEELKIPTIDIGQGMSALSAASKETERLIVEGMIAHEGNPFIDWMVECCSVYEDKNGNIKVTKDEADKSLKIDAIIAMIMAISMAAGEIEEPKQFNVTFLEL